MKQCKFAELKTSGYDNSGNRNTGISILYSGRIVHVRLDQNCNACNNTYKISIESFANLFGNKSLVPDASRP